MSHQWCKISPRTKRNYILPLDIVKIEDFNWRPLIFRLRLAWISMTKMFLIEIPSRILTPHMLDLAGTLHLSL